MTKSCVDEVVGPRDERRGVRDEEEREACYLLRFADTTQHRPRSEPGLNVFRLRSLRSAAQSDRAWTNGNAPDADSCAFERHLARERHDTGLCGGKRANRWHAGRAPGGDRRGVDDNATPTRDEVRPREL